MVIYTGHATYLLAIIQEEEGWQRFDTVGCKHGGIRVSLHLDEVDAGEFRLCGEIGENRRHCTARATPGGPEINDDLAGGGNLCDVAGHRCRLCRVGLKLEEGERINGRMV